MFGLTVAGLALATFGLGGTALPGVLLPRGEAGAGKDVKDVPKDKLEKGDKDGKIEPKDKPKKGKDKVETVEYKPIPGVVKGIDFEKASLTIAIDGKERIFAVNESTKFMGPKGGSRGMGKAALKDETLVKGCDVGVVPAPDEKAALVVYLPMRKSEPKDNDKDKKDGK
jgi:hypothetical protein